MYSPVIVLVGLIIIYCSTLLSRQAHRAYLDSAECQRDMYDGHFLRALDNLERAAKKYEWLTTLGFVVLGAGIIYALALAVHQFLRLS